ncbi:MAG: hypothetical protein IT439_00735 [Phycisphaerales bacterium]|nr:hypothetical protein [Phycisphaerales bacterium]
MPHAPRLTSQPLHRIGICLVCACAAATGQPETPPQVRPDALPQPPVVGVALQPEPLRFEDLGLSISIPEGATSRPGTTGKVVRSTIVAPDESWALNIQTPAASQLGIGVKDFADRLMEEVFTRFALVGVKIPAPGTPATEWLTRTDATLLRRTDDLRIDGLEAIRLAFSMPMMRDGVGAAREVRVYTIVQASPGQFVVFEFITPASAYPDNRIVHDTVVASATFRDPGKVESERGSAIMRGVGLRSMLGPSNYDWAIALNADVWERLFIPAPTKTDRDAQELGYRHIRAWRGARGELDSRKRPEDFDAAERMQGYLLVVQSRLVQNEDQIVDSIGRYFVSLDGREESWNILMTLRPVSERAKEAAAGKKPATYAEFGFRDGERTKVVVSAPNEPSQEILPEWPGDGYAPQALVYLLPQLVLLGNRADTYGFYVYRSADRRMQFRKLVVDQPEDNTDIWRVSAFLVDAAAPQVSHFRADGTHVRTVLPDGKVWEPTTVDQLVSLWSSKGLPME